MNRSRLQQQRDWLRERVNSGGRSFSPWDALELLDALLETKPRKRCPRCGSHDGIHDDSRCRVAWGSHKDGAVCTQCGFVARIGDSMNVVVQHVAWHARTEYADVAGDQQGTRMSDDGDKEAKAPLTPERIDVGMVEIKGTCCLCGRGFRPGEFVVAAPEGWRCAPHCPAQPTTLPGEDQAVHRLLLIAAHEVLSEVDIPFMRAHPSEELCERVRRNRLIALVDAIDAAHAASRRA